MGSDSASSRAVVSAQARAAHESSAEPSALNGASQDCTDGTDQPHACAARTIFENRTAHSIRAENAAGVYKPLRKTRSALSAEFDGAMTRLGYTNVQIATRCGVTEKSVRQWRGRDLQSGEVAKPIPSDMLVHLPDELFQEMYIALRGLRVVERQAKAAA